MLVVRGAHQAVLQLMKRRKVGNAQAVGSRFVHCPACQATVPSSSLNNHLDTACNSSPPERSSLPAAPPPPDGAAKHNEGDRATPTIKWWEQAQQPHPLAFATSSTGRQRNKPQPLSDEQLREAAPCDIVRQALPKELAEELLTALLVDAPGWARGQWIMFGKTHDAPRTSCFYSLADSASEVQDADDYRDVSALVERRAASDALRRAADIVDAKVQQLQMRVEAELAARDVQSGWSASYALANLYKDGSEAVGAHSDRITPLGKRPTIASLSLGATRTFRLRRAATADDTETPEQKQQQQQQQGAAKSGEEEGAGTSTSGVDIQLEHNTLLVMWPPTQEEWRHEVPRSKRVAPHPLSGLARVNLTFRRQDPESAARAPQCRCGNAAVLKAALKRKPPGRPLRPGQHAYYYACDNTKGSCGFWQWDTAA